MTYIQPLRTLKPNRYGYKKFGILSSLMLGSLLVNTLGFAPQVRAAATPVSALTAQLPAATDDLPQEVRDRLLQQIAEAITQDTGTPPTTLTLHSVRAETWSDGCLGLGGPAELCLAAETPGWRVEVSDGAITRVYRTDATAQTIRQEHPVADVNEFPRLTASRVLDEVRRTSGLPLEQLEIVAAEPRTWDGCFGLASADQMCTQIAILGWRVIVTAPDHVWVYHTNQDGTDVRQNDVASQQGNALLLPGFIDAGDYPMFEGWTEDVLMTVLTRGGIAGQTEKTVLYRDGAIARYTLQGDTYGPPTQLGQVSPAQLERFRRGVQRTQLGRFQGLRYPTPANTADSLMVTVMPEPYSLIQYDDTAGEQLPRSLQQFHRRWNRLMVTATRNEGATPSRVSASPAR